MDLFLQQTVNAVALGGTCALLALGLAVVFSIMGPINFAHGELITISGWVLMFCGLAAVPFVIAVPRAILTAMAAAMAMDRIAFRPVRSASGPTMLVTSFAVAMILQVLFQTLISVRSHPVAIPDVRGQSVALGGLVIGVNKIVARLMRIRVNTVISAAFALSGLLAGVAAVLWVSQRASVDPMIGFTPVSKVFLAAFLLTDWQAFREPIGFSLVVLVLVVRRKGLIPAATLKAQKA